MNIFLIIWKKFRGLMVFLLLAAFSIGMLLSMNSYQNSFLFQATTTVRSNFLASFSLIHDYFKLGEENLQLRKENTHLREQLENIKLECADFVTNGAIPKRLHYITAKVAYNSIGVSNNILVINKGEKDGIKPEMAVLSAQGLVGIVYNVTEDYASVLPIINTTFSCLVAIKAHTLTASTSWDASDYRYIDVKGVPLHLSIRKNDAIYTNNNSTLYPSNQLIGTVESVKKEDLGKSFTLKVKLATNFARLQNVYVIENKDKQQIDSLRSNE